MLPAFTHWHMVSLPPPPDMLLAVCLCTIHTDVSSNLSHEHHLDQQLQLPFILLVDTVDC